MQSRYKRPVCLQMLVAGMLSLLTMSIISCLIYILTFDNNGNQMNIINQLNRWLSYWECDMIIYFPVCLSSLLLIHYMGIFKNIMYSAKMVVFESALFVVSEKLLYYKLLIDGHYLLSAVLFSAMIAMYMAYMIKKIFIRRYDSFQNGLKILDMKPRMDERVDNAIAIITNLILLIPGLTITFLSAFYWDDAVIIVANANLWALGARLFGYVVIFL